MNDASGQRVSRALAVLFCAVVLVAYSLKDGRPVSPTTLGAGSRDGHLAAGLRYHQQGALDTALGEYTEAARLDPLSALAQYDIGVVRYQMKNIAAAREAYKRAVALDPRFADAQFNLGYLELHDASDPNAAVPPFRAAIEANPQMAKAYYELGLAYEALGMIDRARSAWELAVRIDPAAYRDVVSGKLATSPQSTEPPPPRR